MSITKKILNICALAAFVVLPALSYGQEDITNNPKKNTNQSSQNSQGNDNDQTENNRTNNENTFNGINIPLPEKPLTDKPLQPNLFQTLEDDGAESEDEIIYASFNSDLIHYPKMDLSKMTDTVVIHLVNHHRGMEFHYPTPETAIITSHFGARKNRWHYGVDIAQPTGKPIYAAFDGTVRVSAYNGSYGNLVVIRHNNGLETYYAHMSRREVSSGDQVKAGDVIGLCGNTGRSYGSHLHFEIRYMGHAMNPEHVIDCYKHELRMETLYLTRHSFDKVGSSHSYTPPRGHSPSTSVASTSSSTSGTSTTQSKPAPAKSGPVYHKVKQGDTLGKIAKRYNTTVKRICQLNGIKETTTLKIGRSLRVK